ncbi:hypothetical protein P154DRAFT_539653 [Amniculicola lignicola CBS 123094]|uniref:BZIP domain-containing protein n=1 Tax=Amniculicola lignicola CBS 123094 TaxID=1392246 RepID=A0A6A5W032_9PLEO|nr:hypothetical protein P154DRAFT_539653 [Amniculicola lignicola CBS 123094]
MIDEQDPILRRKIQNRNAQRRFRNRIRANNEVVVFQRLATPDSITATLPTTPIFHEDSRRPTSAGPVSEADSLNPAGDTWPAPIWSASRMGDAFSDTPSCDMWNDQETNYQIDPSDHYNPSPHEQHLLPTFADSEGSGLIQSPWPIPVLSATRVQTRLGIIYVQSRLAVRKRTRRGVVLPIELRI